MNPFLEVERLQKEQGTHKAPQWRVQQVPLSTGGHRAQRAERLQCNSQWRNEGQMHGNHKSYQQHPPLLLLSFFTFSGDASYASP